jgi:hypothetical protein
MYGIRKLKKWIPFKYQFENRVNPNSKRYDPVYVEKVSDSNELIKVFCA